MSKIVNWHFQALPVRQEAENKLTTEDSDEGCDLDTGVSVRGKCGILKVNGAHNSVCKIDGEDVVCGCEETDARDQDNADLWPA
jgi:hypothetical protein